MHADAVHLVTYCVHDDCLLYLDGLEAALEARSFIHRWPVGRLKIFHTSVAWGGLEAALDLSYLGISEINRNVDSFCATLLSSGFCVDKDILINICTSIHGETIYRSLIRGMLSLHKAT